MVTEIDNGEDIRKYVIKLLGNMIGQNYLEEKPMMFQGFVVPLSLLTKESNPSNRLSVFRMLKHLVMCPQLENHNNDKIEAIWNNLQ